MNLIYGKHLTGSSIRNSLVAAAFGLAAMLLLLWIGSLRGVDAAAAEGIKSSDECSQDLLYECSELSMQSRPLVQTTTQSSNENPVDQQVVAGAGFLSIAALENAGITSGGHVAEGCLLLSAPCLSSFEPAPSGAEQGAAGHPFGELMPTTCLYPIPCGIAGEGTGELMATGHGFQGELAVQ